MGKESRAIFDVARWMRHAKDLHQAGHLTQAQTIYRQVLDRKPEHADALHLLGVSCHQSGDHAHAVELLTKAIDVNPLRPVFHNNLGSAQRALQRFDDALASYRRSLVLDAGAADTHYNLGVMLSDLGHAEQALASYRNAIALQPDCVSAHYNCGIVLKKSGNFDEAADCFRQVLVYQPDNDLARHFLAMLTGTPSDRAPDQYVANLFDGCADTFDTHLVQELGYDTPHRLLDLIREFAMPAAQQWEALDLGCGTGLVGAAIAPYVHRMVGVDLSANMLAKARALQLYQRLEQAELVAAMRCEAAESYDLVIAADVFNYFGRLDTVCSETRRLLRPGGLFAFSVEALDAETDATAITGTTAYRLNMTGRYTHGSGYLKELAAHNGFRACRMRCMPARVEDGKSVPAWLVLWQR